MAQIYAQNPGSSEIISPRVAGITEALGKISSILDMKTGTITDVVMSAVPIDNTDANKNRIYEAPSNNRLWLASPAPVFKKNGVEITPENEDFSVDYVGGSITFNSLPHPENTDVITVSATFIQASSTTVEQLTTLANEAKASANKYKGNFSTVESLNTSIATANVGDFALVITPLAFYAWDGEQWADTRSIEDLSNYYDKDEVDNKLAGKENKITAMADEPESDDFYWSGRKTFQNVNEKVRNTVLTGFDSTVSGEISEEDTVLTSLEKLNSKPSGSKTIAVTLLASLWSDEAPYSQSVSVHGMTDANNFSPPWFVPSGDREQDEAMSRALSCISYGQTGENSVTFYCYREKPAADITIRMTESPVSIGQTSVPDPVQAALAAMEEQIARMQLLVASVAAPNAGAHNAIYRGKYLGDHVTDEQYAAIDAGAFDDLFIGDYWTIGGINYRIAAFDYYLRCGNTDLTSHHVVIVPDTCLYNAQMNPSNTTEGGYVGSAMYTANLNSAKGTIRGAFTGHILTHRVYLVNAVANGRSSDGVWADSDIELMCEQMVYGSAIFSPTSDGTTVPSNYRVEKSQLPLFTHRPDLISDRQVFWLRDVVTAAYFACVNNYGDAYCDNASRSFGVRPAFCIS